MDNQYLTRSRLAALRAALPELVDTIRPTHHLTFTMTPNVRRSVLEDRIGEWVVRVNRRFLGRNWYLEKNLHWRMQGFVFFETGKSGDNHHAHAIVRPPEGTAGLNFEDLAPHVFVGSGNGERPVLKRLAVGGSVHVQRIQGGDGDLRRLVGYDTKEMENRVSAYEDWCFIDNLTRQGRR